MNYEFVKDIFNVNPIFSSTVRLWKNVSTNTYYVSYDFKEIIRPVKDDSYMLLSDKQESKESLYRVALSPNAKQLTLIDFLNGSVEYNGSYWKLN